MKVLFRILIFLFFIPSTSFAQASSKPILPIKIELKSDMAKSLLDYNLEMVEEKFSWQDHDSVQMTQLMARYVKNKEKNIVWGTFIDRRGDTLGHIYYSFNQDNLLDTMLSYDKHKQKIDSKTFFTYDSLGRMIEEKEVYFSGYTTLSKYQFQIQQDGTTIKKYERFKDSEFPSFKSVEHLRADGKPLSFRREGDSLDSLKIKYYYKDNDRFIQEIYISEEAFINYTRIIFCETEFNCITKIINTPGDTTLEEMMTFDLEKRILKKVYWRVREGKEIETELLFFDENMRIVKSILETPFRYSIKKEETFYNQYGLPDSTIYYWSKGFTRSLYYKYHE